MTRTKRFRYQFKNYFSNTILCWKWYFCELKLENNSSNVQQKAICHNPFGDLMKFKKKMYKKTSNYLNFHESFFVHIKFLRFFIVNSSVLLVYNNTNHEKKIFKWSDSEETIICLKIIRLKIICMKIIRLIIYKNSSYV